MWLIFYTKLSHFYLVKLYVSCALPLDILESGVDTFLLIDRDAHISAVAFHPTRRMAVSSSNGGDFKVFLDKFFIDA